MLTSKETPLTVDRRDSSRWATDKVLWWRPDHGRKSRCSKIVERSLTSMAFFSSVEDAPPVGTILKPSDPLMGNRHGFRVAVVRRVVPVDNGDLVYVEILS